MTVVHQVHAQQKKEEGFQLVEKEGTKKVDVVYNGEVITSYCYYDELKKPMLFPVKTISGVTVTRGYPFEPVAGERIGYPHQAGLWLNYESVNGLDFWNNSNAVPPDERARYGVIKHDRIASKSTSRDKATLEVSAQWKRPDNFPLLAETTRFYFQVQDSTLIIDRITTLHTLLEKVLFGDVKDGLIAMRLAREFELPSSQPDFFIGSDGKILKEKMVNNDRVSGAYINSEGVKGDSIWGTRAKWVAVSGEKKDKQISIVMMDHPDNFGYPAYWHVRPYGLIAANPFGKKVFTNSGEESDYTLEKGQSVILRYRIIIHEGGLSKEAIDKFAKDFYKQYYY